MVTKNAAESGISIVCALILCVILSAGLWPFHRPLNDASWDRERNGIRFGGRGEAISQAPALAKDDPCTLEIWLQPEGNSQTGTIIAFYDPAAPTDFSLFEEPAGLGFRLHDQIHRKGPHHYGLLKGVLHSGEPVLVTITSNTKITAVYVDGRLAKTMQNFPLTLRNLGGQIVLGTSPGGDSGWTGEILGIATYGRMLALDEVPRHYEAWVKTGRPEQSSSTVAVNLFHNGTDFKIPVRYSVIHKPLLSLSGIHLADWRDIGLNIAGFVPLGFFFCAYFSTWRRAGAITILTGFALSLFIEVMQVYLPGRTSDWRNVAMNTLGTVIGVLSYRVITGDEIAGVPNS